MKLINTFEIFCEVHIKVIVFGVSAYAKLDNYFQYDGRKKKKKTVTYVKTMYLVKLM